MIRIKYIDFSQEKRKNEVEKYYSLLIENRAKNRLSRINEWCIENLEMTFKEIVIASPLKLNEIKKRLTPGGDLYEPMLKFFKPADKSSYIVSTLYGKMSDDTKDYLINTLDVRVCPYCNRNYIFSGDNNRTCEFDHFIPKSKYPIFAVSFYNLIPSCGTCNKNKKENENFNNPYLQDKGKEFFKFSYHLQDVDGLVDCHKVNIDEVQVDSEYQEQMRMLDIHGLYKHHNDVVFDMIRKKQVFTDDYLRAMTNDFPGLNLDFNVLKDLVFDRTDIDDYSNKPLSKLKHDIGNELD